MKISIILLIALTCIVSQSSYAAQFSGKLKSKSVGTVVEIHPDHPIYSVGQSAFVLVKQKFWPDNSDFQIQLHASLDGADMQLKNDADYTFSCQTPALALGNHLFSVTAYMVNTLTHDEQLFSTQSITLTATSQAPSISVDPVSGTLIRMDTPTISASFSGGIAGIDLNSFHATMDGIDITSKAVLSSDRAVIQFTADSPLTQGTHHFQIQISNQVGISSSLSTDYTVDLGKITQGFFTGAVEDLQGSPVVGASVVTTDAPVGVSLQGATDQNGVYKIAFSAGGSYAFLISKNGYTSSIREATAVDGRDTTVEKSILSPADTKVTQISATTGGTASNSSETVRLVVPPGAAPADFTFSATNYTAGNQLPGLLPPLSQFTYAHANNFSFAKKGNPSLRDGNISFSSPVTMIIENDLGFPVGTQLVYGNYDPVSRSWIDGGDAVVIATKSRSGSSISYPFNEAYPAHDTNQPVVLPPDSVPPAGGGGPPGGPPEPPGCPGCRIDINTGTLAEDVQLPPITRFGSDYSLKFSYNSTSAFPTAYVNLAYSTLVHVPVWLTPAPSGAGSVTVNIAPDSAAADIKFEAQEVHGAYTGTAATTLSFERNIFEAKNAEGSLLPTGSYPYEATLASSYSNNPYASAAYFGAPPGISLNVIAREPVQLKGTVSGRTIVQNDVLSPFGAGWTLNGQERLYADPEGTIVWTDGSGIAKLFTPLGTAQSSRSLKMLASLSKAPISSLTEKDGFIYAASCEGNVVYRVDLDGHATVVAGIGERGFSGDGFAATSAKLNCPMSVEIAKGGGFYIADSGNFRIRKVDSDGKISTLGGNGSIEIGVDGSVASQVGIGRPLSVSEDPMRAVLFTSTGNNIMMIDPRGKLRTYSAEDAGYVKVKLSHPSQVIYDDLGNPIVVDTGNNRIIKLIPATGGTQPVLGGSASKNGSSSLALNQPVRIAYDKALKRYFILEKSGRILMWMSSGLQQLLPVGRSKASGMTFSPEEGLLLAKNGMIRAGLISGRRSL
jgi:hypothetical protein